MRANLLIEKIHETKFIDDLIAGLFVVPTWNKFEIKASKLSNNQLRKCMDTKKNISDVENGEIIPQVHSLTLDTTAHGKKKLELERNLSEVEDPEEELMEKT